ncbi:MAG: glycosyltransferase family 2 protein [Lachnospiraceae bacterium]|nr:glycosyltransferase family 2 protein [Lachnospiraceae bacterium]
MTYRNHSFPSDMGLRDRIHRRELACLWVGDVHEAIQIKSEWNRLVCCDITIIHKKEHINEPGRNMRIFNDIKKSGKLSGAYMLSYYCRELALAGATKAALKAWQDLPASDPPANQVHYALVFLTGMLLRQKDYEKYRMLVHTSCEDYGVPRSAFLYYNLGLAAEGLGEMEEAERLYRLAANTPVDITGGMIEFTGYDDYLPSLKLCALCYDRKDMESAEAWNMCAGRAWPEGRAWRINRELFFTPPLMPGRDPLVSVIVRCRKGMTGILEGISSILDQTWQNFELFIVGYVPDDIAASISDPRIIYPVEDCPQSIAACMNRAFSASRGEYIAFMDASDISLPDRLKAQVTYLENKSDIMILGTASLSVDRDGKVKKRPPLIPDSAGRHRARMLIGKPEFCISSIMTRKSFLDDEKLVYKEGFSGLEDYQFIMEASKAGDISCLARVHYKICGYDARPIDDGEDQSPGREARYNRIRCDSLHLSGVKLNEREEALLGHLLPEDKLPLWTRKEREQLTGLFASIRTGLLKEGFAAIHELDEIILSILNH